MKSKTKIINKSLKVKLPVTLPYLRDGIIYEEGTKNYYQLIIKNHFKKRLEFKKKRFTK